MMDAKLTAIVGSVERGALSVLGERRPAGVDLGLARACVEASARAYAEVSFESGLAHVLVVADDGAQGTRPTIVAFRGSADRRDWLTDFGVRFWYTACGRVHAGFWDSTSSVMGNVAAVGPGPVIVTGHSKGAAEALICARRLAEAGREVSAVITFGGPRVGDAAWRTGYNQLQMANGKCLGDITQRWVHEEDIVPRLPVWISGYRHVGHEYFLSSFGGVEVDPSIWRLAASDIWGTFWGYRKGHIEQAEDHPVSRYLEHINQL
jgi:hypothetical protein